MENTKNTNSPLRKPPWYEGFGKLMLLVMFLVMAPQRPAHAYLDPNAAGPLYQMLFPLLVAIGSAIAMTKRYIREFWNRAVAALAAAFRRKPVDSESQRLP